MAERTTTDLIAAKLEELAQHCADQITALKHQPEQGDPTVKDEIKFYTAQYAAYMRALGYWSDGLRPQLLPSGAYLIPSGSQRTAAPHRIEKHGHIWLCGPTCKATAFHWHTALMTAIESVDEAAAQLEDEDEPFPAATAATFGARLARARASVEARYA
jgi:hypothetical protein